MKIELLLGIAEPWNFQSTDGENVLRAWADSSCAGVNSDGEYLIVNCTPFDAKGQVASSLLLDERSHEGGLFSALQSRRKIGVNALWRDDVSDWSHEIAQQLKRNSAKYAGGFLIATVEVVSGVFEYAPTKK